MCAPLWQHFFVDPNVRRHEIALERLAANGPRIDFDFFICSLIVCIYVLNCAALGSDPACCV